MSGYQPYKNDYFPQQKKKKLFSILIPFLLITVTALFFLTGPKTDKDTEPSKSVKTDTRPSEIDKVEGPDPDQYESLERRRKNPPPPPEIQIEAQENSSPADTSAPVYITKRTVLNKPLQEEEWKSDVDLEREQGIAIFEEVIRQCSDTRERIKQLQIKYDNTCTGTLYDAFGNLINRAATRECLGLMREIRTLKTELQNNLQLAMENARRAGVYPGQIRDVLQKYGFENL